MAHTSVEEHSTLLPTTTGLDHRKLLMWVFLASECLFFGSLISTYLIYRGKSLVGPYPHDVFNIPYTSISAFVLLMSSLTMVLALAALRPRPFRSLALCWIAVYLVIHAVIFGVSRMHFPLVPILALAVAGVFLAEPVHRDRDATGRLLRVPPARAVVPQLCVARRADRKRAEGVRHGGTGGMAACGISSARIRPAA